MSSRKNNLLAYQNITAAAMNQDITSDVTNVQFLDNIAIQLNFSGNPTGTFAVEMSIDYAQDFQGNVTNAGNWIALSLNPPPVASGSADSIYLDLNQLAGPWIRVSYTNTMLESADITAVADVAGSLNNKYFLINGADGTNWYVWYDDGAGVDPAIVGRTGIQVVYADNDSANTIATLTRAALASCTSITSIGGATSHITFTQDLAGTGSIADGTAATGFTFSYTANTGVLNGYISGKMI